MKEVKSYFPDFDALAADTEEIEYHYSLNSVKDSLLENQDNFGVRFDKEGNLLIDQKLAIRASVYSGGYRTELRTLYPHLKAHIKFTIADDKKSLRVQVKQLKLESCKVSRDGKLLGEEEFYAANSAN